MNNARIFKSDIKNRKQLIMLVFVYFINQVLQQNIDNNGKKYVYFAL